MEEDKIKEIFRSYDPEISSSMAFMERLERNLNAVELIHQENASVMRRNRIAVALASCAGFITGVVFTLMYPYIDGLIHSLLTNILVVFSLSGEQYGIQLISWLLIGGISVLVALNTYRLSTTLLHPNKDIIDSSQR